MAAPLGCLHPSAVGVVTSRAPVVCWLGLLELVLVTQVGNPGIVLPVFNSETGTALRGVVRAGSRSPGPPRG